MTKIYSISPFFNEFDLLDLKISEESLVVDKILIIEANQTFQGNKKELLLENNLKYSNLSNVEIVFLKDELATKKTNDKFANAAYQKNSYIRFLPDIKDDDVLLMCDLDEINKKENISMIVDKAKKHGIVRLMEHFFYYKINLVRNTVKGWNAPYAVTGKALKDFNYNAQTIRIGRIKGIGKNIATDGKHFSFLMSPEDICYKIGSFSHTEFMNPRFTDVEKIKERIKKKIDPFDRKSKNGDLLGLTKIEIDETYPNTILNNLTYWAKHIA